ncbi:MAG: hypothetical protein ACKOX2_13500, partial [Microcystaceae cyanobacterium]
MGLGMLSILIGILSVSGLFSLLPNAHFMKQLSSSSSPIACLENERLFVQAETRDLWLGICGIETPQFYLSVKKSNEASPLRLPLKEHQSQAYQA